MPSGRFAPTLWNGFGSRRNSTTSRSSSLASSTPAMSSQPIACLTSGLICTGFVRGISLMVRHRKVAMMIMKTSAKTPCHSSAQLVNQSIWVSDRQRSARA